MRNACVPSSSKCLAQQILNKSKNSTDGLGEINEIPRSSRADGEVQSKSKFIVTRAVDPLHFK